MSHFRYKRIYHILSINPLTITTTHLVLLHGVCHRVKKYRLCDCLYTSLTILTLRNTKLHSTHHPFKVSFKYSSEISESYWELIFHRFARLLCKIQYFYCVNKYIKYDLLKRLFRRRLKETSKLRVTGLCAGNSPGDRWIPRTNGQ